MNIYIDIDNTICKTEGMDYENAKPFKDRIEKLNKLSKDNILVYYSARGVGSGINYYKLTRNQFKKWGVKYDLILLEKQPFDLLIDDKAINADTYFNG